MNSMTLYPKWGIIHRFIQQKLSHTLMLPYAAASDTLPIQVVAVTLTRNLPKHWVRQLTFFALAIETSACLNAHTMSYVQIFTAAAATAGKNASWLMRIERAVVCCVNVL
jgi:hypothetical protein